MTAISKQNSCIQGGDKRVPELCLCRAKYLRSNTRINEKDVVYEERSSPWQPGVGLTPVAARFRFSFLAITGSITRRSKQSPVPSGNISPLSEHTRFSAPRKAVLFTSSPFITRRFIHSTFPQNYDLKWFVSSISKTFPVTVWSFLESYGWFVTIGAVVSYFFYSSFVAPKINEIHQAKELIKRKKFGEN